ncbi:hypothetical protein PIROE2DRAFT_69444 [Piromyces sp. E2]|nr:hypothetical protein PIROE2DRAFT_69444 [Piromyces sp. E2]|eukprot:OUM62811.1 hypothetical protein PIROE2DRAFT_69444 [Piromyces sp. E2]
MRRNNKKKEKNQMRADIVVSPLIAVTPSQFNNLKAGDQKSVLAINQNSVMIGDNNIIPINRNSILINDQNKIGGCKSVNKECISIVSGNDPQNELDISIPEVLKLSEGENVNTDSLLNRHELIREKSKSFENIKDAIRCNSANSNNSLTVPPSNTNNNGMELSTSPSRNSFQMVSPQISHQRTNSQNSNLLTVSNSRNSNRHSTVPLKMSSDHGPINPKALEALQNMDSNSNQTMQPPPPSYSDSSFTVYPPVGSSSSSSHNPEVLSSPHSPRQEKEQIDHQNSDICIQPIFIENDRSPIGEIKKTITLPPYSAISFMGCDDEKSKEDKDKEQPQEQQEQQQQPQPQQEQPQPQEQVKEEENK